MTILPTGLLKKSLSLAAFAGLLVFSSCQNPTALTSQNQVPASRNVAPTGTTIGYSHPSSGAFSPVNPSSWATSSWGLGATFPNGAGGTMDVGVYSADATQILLEIYTQDTGASATYDYWMSQGSDNVWRAAISSVPNGTLYAFRAWGPNWPFNTAWTRGNSSAGYITDCDTSGNRFNPNKVLYDPYAKEISHDVDSPALVSSGNSDVIFASGGANVSSTQTYSGPITGNVTMDLRNIDTGAYAPKAVALVDSTSTGTKPNIPEADTIVYETHLKGLTAHSSSVNLTTLLSPYSGFADAANVPSNLVGTYAGAAYMAGYLKDLGINTVEFLPVMETNNQENPSTHSGGNYWGYMTYGFFAPDRQYAHDQSFGGPTKEFKQMVAAFHNAGIQVYLDVVYNHTGEGGTWDGTGMEAQLVSFRGLDNRAYYTLAGTNNNFYWDSTGCGNNFNAGSTPEENLVLSSLNYWSQTMGVDGFRFDLAVELGRNGSSAFSSTAPLLTNIASLASTDGFKIIAEPWDTQDGGEIGNFPAGWANWNGNYRDAVREFMTGNLAGENNLGWADAFYGDYNKFSGEGGPQKSVNMIDVHDGFTLTDLVSYGSQTNSSLSWPFGPSDGGTSNNLSSAWGGNQTMRRQVIRDFWTFQVLSRGIPMVEWGDEFGRTVDGNNNAYNVDSVATWNNYNMIGSASPDTVATGDTTGGTATYNNNLGTFAAASSGGPNTNFAFLQALLKLRAAHPAFNQANYNEAISFLTPAGSSSGFNEWTQADGEVYVSGSQVGDNDFLILVNMTGSNVGFTVPTAPSGTAWVRRIDTNNWAESADNNWSQTAGAQISGSYTVDNQSIVVLQAVPQSTGKFTIKFINNGSSQNVTFPGDDNSWSLTANTLSAAPNTTYTITGPNPITSAVLAQGNNSSTLELQVCNTSSGWNGAWGFASWSRSSNISFSNSADTQLSITCNPGQNVTLTIDVATTSLSATVQ